MAPSLKGIAIEELFIQPLCPSVSAIACLRIIFAAFISLSCLRPQGQLQLLTDSGSSSCFLSHAWQVLELATKRLITYTFFPCHFALYFRQRRNVPQLLSAILLANFLFLIRPLTWRSSTAKLVRENQATSSIISLHVMLLACIFV